jgi:hypothetical protein
MKANRKPKSWTFAALHATVFYFFRRSMLAFFVPMSHAPHT